MPRSRSCEPELLKPPDHRFDGNAEVVSNQNDVAALQPVGASRQFFEFSFDRLSRSDKAARSEEHTSELQSLMRNSYAVFCWKKNKLKSKHSSSQSNNYL